MNMLTTDLEIGENKSSDEWHGKGRLIQFAPVFIKTHPMTPQINVISLARLSAEASAQAGSKDELIGVRSDGRAWQ